MSAITGIFFRDNRPIDLELIEEMNYQLNHRGPDGNDVWIEGNVALGHQMLWTTPESQYETLPFKENGLVITADARIDNRRNLSRKLGIVDKEEISDSYFILKAYEKWGEKCTDFLLGDFVFVIWDEKEEMVFCARDHMGVKQFYYYISDDNFFFATEIKALLIIPAVSKELNEEKLALFLMRDIQDNELTFYKNIKSLPAAHFIKINKNQFIKDRYWKLDSKLKNEMDSEEEYANVFLEIFTEAIKCRLRSYLPVGFELSGGLDSSSVVGIAKNILKKEQGTEFESINTFSRVYDKILECDESFYIQKVIETGNINPNFLMGDNISPLKNINNILWHQDQPFFSPNMTNQIGTYQKISNSGIRILLSGEGGDEIVSHGGNYIRELFFSFRFKKFIEELNGTAKKLDQNVIKMFIKEVVFPSIPYTLKKFINLISTRNTESILNNDFVKNSGVEKVDINRIIDHIGKIKTKDYHYFSINNPLSQTIFGITDRSSSIYNIEERYPFYDKRLIEFCYSLPTEMKLKKGWDRYIMRISMQDILPEEIQWRSQKSNLSGIYKRNLLLFEKNILEKMVYEDNKIIKKYVNLNVIKNIYKKYEDGKTDNLFNFWLVVSVYLWIKYSEIIKV